MSDSNKKFVDWRTWLYLNEHCTTELVDCHGRAEPEGRSIDALKDPRHPRTRQFLRAVLER